MKIVNFSIQSSRGKQISYHHCHHLSLKLKKKNLCWKLLPTVSQCIHCLVQKYIDFHCTQVYMGQKRCENIFTYQLQNFLKSSKESQYHWVSKLSQKWLLKVKNGMKSDNNRFYVNKFLHLGLCSFGIFHHRPWSMDGQLCRNSVEPLKRFEPMFVSHHLYH